MCGDESTTPAPYDSHFEEIGRALDLYDDFALLPVEVPAIDVALALCRWLEQHGQAVHVVSLDSAAWRTVAPRLLSLNVEDRTPVVVIGPRRKTKELPVGLTLLNLRRDTVRRQLRRPLLWVGLRSFLDDTWENAPDFWSIREIAVRIPLIPTRDTSYSGDGGPWIEPTPPPETVREQVAAARKTRDAPNLARALLLLARSLLARDVLDAAERAHREATDIMAASPVFSRTVEGALARETAGDLASLKDTARAGKTEYEEALSAYEAIGDEHGRARVTGKLGVAAYAEGDAATAARLLEAAMATSEALGDDSLRAPLLHALGRLRQRQDAAFDVAEAHYEEALRLFRRLADRAGEAEVLLARSHLRHDQSDFTGALLDCESALSRFAPLDGRNGRVRALAHQAHLQLHLGNYTGARVALDSVLSDREALVQNDWKGWAFAERGTARELLADLSGATADYDTALTMQQPGWRRAITLLRRSQLRHEQEDHRGALADCQTARQLFETRGEWGHAAGCLISIGHHLWAHEACPAEADATLTQAITLLSLPKHAQDRARALKERGAARFNLHAFEDAIGDYDAALAIYRTLDSPGRQAGVFHHRAWCHMRLAEQAFAPLSRIDESMRLVPFLRAITSAGRSFRARLDTALADYSEALTLLEGPESAAQRAIVLCDRARLHMLRGCLQLAAADIDLAVRLCGEGHLLQKARALELRAFLRMRLDDIAPAQSDLAAAGEIFRAAGSLVEETGTVVGLGTAEKLAGNLDEALRLLLDAKRRREALGCGDQSGDIFEQIAQVHLLAGRLLDARAAGERALELTARSSAPSARVRALLMIMDHNPSAARWPHLLLSSAAGKAVARLLRRYALRAVASTLRAVTSGS